MLVTYDGNNKEINKIRFAEDFDPIKNRSEVIISLAKSNARLKDLEEELRKEKQRYDKLFEMRYQIYKYEKLNELKQEYEDKLPSKKSLIELFYSQGKCYDEIALLTESTPEYIYKVISNYRKKHNISIVKSTQSELEETIKLGYQAKMSVEEIAVFAKVSRQYVYKVLKKHNISYPTSKRNKGKMSLQK